VPRVDEDLHPINPPNRVVANLVPNEIRPRFVLDHVEKRGGGRFVVVGN
jgi:hypothetical protein